MKISQILPKESGWKRKNDTQQEYLWHLNTQTQGVPEVKKGGSKGQHIPTDSDRRSASQIDLFTFSNDVSTGQHGLGVIVYSYMTFLSQKWH